MASGKRYRDEFKIEAVRQGTEYGRPVVEVAQRLVITGPSLYAWKKAFSKPTIVQLAQLDQSAEARRLKTKLKRVTEERDILRKPPRTLPRGKGQVRVHSRSFP